MVYYASNASKISWEVEWWYTMIINDILWYLQYRDGVYVQFMANSSNCSTRWPRRECRAPDRQFHTGSKSIFGLPLDSMGFRWSFARGSPWSGYPSTWRQRAAPETIQEMARNTDRPGGRKHWNNYILIYIVYKRRVCRSCLLKNRWKLAYLLHKRYYADHIVRRAHWGGSGHVVRWMRTGHRELSQPAHSNSYKKLVDDWW